MRSPLFTYALLLLLLPGFAEAEKLDPKKIIEKVVRTMGGKERFFSLKDVEYRYIYRDANSGKSDVSVERYLFDGERSWARYLKREKVVATEVQGELIQGFDGSKSWAVLNGKQITDSKILRQTDFLRKTNYYWFAMMFKLLDPGIIYAYQGEHTAGNTTYDLVKISFEVGIGDVSDTYLLYVNRKTSLVDRFLFTVMDFNKTEPLLMEVTYSEIAGVLLPTYRRYTPSNWKGEISDPEWIEEISEEITFSNGFEDTLFEHP